MRCAADGCGYDGWVPRRIRRRHTPWWTRRQTRQWAARLRPWARAFGALALVGLGVGVGAAVGAAWNRANAPTLVQQRAALPPGEYHDGDPLPAAHPLAQAAAQATAPLDVRGACVWGQPGRNPYRGSVAEALQTAHLPAAVQAQFVAKIAARQSDARLVIANDGIRDTAQTRHFAATGFAMTYGRTLCLEARVNFAAGHTEPADLYEVHAGGRRYAVMVPDVCGNVSVITDASSSDELLKLGSGRGMPSQLQLATLEGSGGGEGTHTVPVPSTLACVLAALLAWLGVALVRRRRRSRA